MTVDGGSGADRDQGADADQGHEQRSTDGGPSPVTDPASAASGSDGAYAVDRPTDLRTLASVFLKGLFMGAADTVPGVSGGTVALVTGIYDRLIAAVTGFDPRDLRHLLRLHRPEGRAGLRRTLRDADAPFLVALLAGVLTAVASVAGAVETLLARRPGPLYGFFFGLIAASAVVLLREVTLDARRVGIGAVAVVAVVGLTLATGGTTPRTLPVLFAAAAVAASAMVLPGISGSFLLLLLGQYERFVGVVTDFLAAVSAAAGGDPEALVAPLTAVVVFGAGAVTGVLTVAHAVGWALSTHRQSTLAALVGLLVGGLALPVLRVAETTPLTVGGLAPVVGAALLGVVGLLTFDRYTGDLSY